MISVVDYGLGNINAFVNILKELSCKYTVVDHYKDLSLSDKIILPGVGSYDWAMNLLNKSNMRDTLDELVLVKKKQILGVCVGMQIMSNKSEEGINSGLGWINASVKKINNNNLSVPHIGWNFVFPETSCYLTKDISNPQFYFLHSYYIDVLKTSFSKGFSIYGEKFTTIIQKENIFGTQFHPEKSHEWGIKLLKNFVKL